MTPILEIAKCCGTCVEANRKAQPKPEDHAPHYMIAKTERWCRKHNIPTVREAVCSDWELELKKGGAPAVKRALSQNRRLLAISELKKRLLKEKSLDHENYRFVLQDGFVAYAYLGDKTYWSKLSCKENRFDKLLFGKP